MADPSVKAFRPQLRMLTRGPSASSEDLETSYRQSVRDVSQTTHLVGIADTDAGLSTDLSRLYVDHRLRCLDDAGIAIATTGDTISVDRLLSLGPRAVIAGAPGSGKSTLLDYIALRTAETSPERHEVRQLLPIPINLADVAHSRGPTSSSTAFIDIIRRRIGSRFGEQSASLVHQSLTAGRALLLLDGLDEVPSGPARSDIMAAIESTASDYPSIGIIVTSRPTSSTSLHGFQLFSIEPWSDEQIHQFSVRWSQAYHERLAASVPAESVAEDFYRLVQSSPELRSMARNPLLLTIITVLHRSGMRLPDGRVSVYGFAADYMIGQWEQNAGNASALVAPDAAEQARQVLSDLALQMSMRSQQSMRLDEAYRVVSDSPRDYSSPTPTSFLDSLIEWACLISADSAMQLAFTHLVFQEYFAARSIASMPDSDAMRFARDHFFDPYLEEPVRLALGLMRAHGRGDLARDIVEELLRGS